MAPKAIASEKDEAEKRQRELQFEEVKRKVVAAVQNALTPLGFEVYTAPTTLPPRFMTEAQKPSTQVMNPTPREFVPVYISTGLSLAAALQLPEAQRAPAIAERPSPVSASRQQGLSEKP
jgi:hypothetical protein